MAWTNLPWCLHFSRGTDLLSTGELPDSRVLKIGGSSSAFCIRRRGWLVQTLWRFAQSNAVQSVASMDATLYTAPRLMPQRFLHSIFTFLKLSWGDFLNECLAVLMFCFSQYQETSAINSRRASFDSNLTLDVCIDALRPMLWIDRKRHVCDVLLHLQSFVMSPWPWNMACQEACTSTAKHPWLLHPKCRCISTKSRPLSEANHFCFILNLSSQQWSLWFPTVTFSHHRDDAAFFWIEEGKL